MFLVQGQEDQGNVARSKLGVVSDRSKCDQQWPVCGQCRKSSRRCDGPPQTRFIHSLKTGVIKEPLSWKHGPKVDPSLSNNRGDHLSLTRAPCLTFSERIAAGLAETMHFDLCGLKSSGFGRVLANAPKMLDTSPCLTAALACCLTITKRRTRSSYKGEEMDPVKYGIAISQLRKALGDPKQARNTSTLMAAAILQRIEVWQVLYVSFPCFLTLMLQSMIATPPKLPWTAPNWSVHTMGVSSLLQYQGPFNPQNDACFFVLLENIGPITWQYIMRGEDSFLAKDEWLQILSERKHANATDRILYQTFSHTVKFPRLLRGLRLARAGKIKLDPVKQLAQGILNGLFSLEKPIQSLLRDKTHVTLCEPSPASGFCPVPKVYKTVSTDLSRVCCFHALHIIAFTMALLKLDAHDPTMSIISINPRRLDRIHARNYGMACRIWMFHEQARQIGLLAFHHYTTALLSSYSCAKNEEEQQWIVNQMNELQGRNEGSTDELWTTEAIRARVQAVWRD